MRVLNILRWVVLSAFLAALAVPAVVISLTDSTIVQVDGMSMSPTYAIGDVVVIRPPQPTDLRVGAVVTAQTEGHERYTHRIHEVLSDGSLVLRGDANEVDDDAPIAPSSVIGVVDGHFTGIAATAILQLQSWPLRVCILAIILGLLFMPMAARAAGAGRRAAVAPMEDGAHGQPASPAAASTAPMMPARRRRPEQSGEDPKQEVLDLVDSVRSSVARVLLASDRRLGGNYTVTTKPGRGGFPDVRVVIDIVPKGELTAERPALAVAPEGVLSRRALRAQPTGSDSHLIAPPVRRAGRDERRAESPARRNRSVQAQHGRRRAR